MFIKTQGYLQCLILYKPLAHVDDFIVITVNEINLNIQENECFQDALRNSQKRLLKVSRDRSFLLDRLLQYEKPDSSTSESEDTESSDDTEYHRVDALKRYLLPNLKSEHK